MREPDKVSSDLQVWKLGTKMRVDGSLMGIDDKRTSLLPQWKRGHFSLLFDGATTPATLLLCDHAKKKYLDLSKEKKKHKPSLDDEVAPSLFEICISKYISKKNFSQ